jgi:hypothetical protein
MRVASLPGLQAAWDMCLGPVLAAHFKLLKRLLCDLKHITQ